MVARKTNWIYMRSYYEEEDYIVEPRIKQNKKKKEEDDLDWYSYETPLFYKPKLMMAPKKKRELEEYNFQRIQQEKDNKIQEEVKKYLEEQNIPRDIINDILNRAGFYSLIR